MTECSCPICPLVKANVQVCNVLYEEEPNNKFALHCSMDMRHFHEQFEQLVYCAKADKTPIGHNWEHTGEDHKCDIKRLSEKIYKICFHALKSGVASEEDDPLAMD